MIGPRFFFNDIADRESVITLVAFAGAVVLFLFACGILQNLFLNPQEYTITRRYKKGLHATYKNLPSFFCSFPYPATARYFYKYISTSITIGVGDGKCHYKIVSLHIDHTDSRENFDSYPYSME